MMNLQCKFCAVEDSTKLALQIHHQENGYYKF
jgi:hypothetical protein